MQIENSGLKCFLILAKFLGINVTTDDFNDFADSGKTEYALLKLAKNIGIKAKIVKLKIKALEDLKIPVLAREKNGQYFLILRKKEEKFLVLKPEQQQPELMTEKEIQVKWDGTALLISDRKIKNEAAGSFGFRWFIPTILKFKKQFIQVFIAVFVIQIVGILTPVMTQVVVDKVLTHNSLSTLYTITIGIIIVYIYELVISLAKNYVFTHTTNRIDVILSFRLFKHLFELPLKYFEARRVGETVARVRELDHIRSFLTGTPLSSIIDFMFIIVYITVLLFYNVPLTIIVIASIPIYALLSLIITPLFKKCLDEKFSAGAETQSFLVESVTGIQTIKSFSLETKFEQKWGDIQADYVKASYKTSMVSQTSGSIGGFIQKMIDVLILFFGAQAVLKGDFTVGQLVAFRMLSGRVSGPVLRLVQLWQEYQQASLSVQRIGDIFRAPAEPAADTHITVMPRVKGRITFDKVRFRYRVDTPEVIKDISFTIEPGSVIGIVGRSGSGKSTLSKLIQRLYIAENGKISIDGMDISLLNPSQLRKQIGIVLQENFMFSGTVRENISIHYPTATAEEVLHAAKVAGAHEFILELSNGYDTLIGEKGISLSGGQKQRIAIARAVIANPRILIFDEATSSLDYESESIIQNNLKDICRGRTVIIIAHRLSTLKDAEKIMVLDHGNLVEYDTPEELMKQQGLYYYLYNQQQKGAVE